VNQIHNRLGLSANVVRQERNESAARLSTLLGLRDVPAPLPTPGARDAIRRVVVQILLIQRPVGIRRGGTRPSALAPTPSLPADPPVDRAEGASPFPPPVPASTPPYDPPLLAPPSTRPQGAEAGRRMALKSEAAKKRAGAKVAQEKDLTGKQLKEARRARRPIADDDAVAEPSAVAPWVLGLMVFVVVGSFLLQIIRNTGMAGV